MRRGHCRLGILSAGLSLVACGAQGPTPGENERHASAPVVDANVEASTAPTPKVEPGWLDTVELRIATGALRFSSHEHGFVAKNLEQRIQGSLDERGMLLSSFGHAFESHGAARIRFAAWGRSNALRDVGAATPEQAGCLNEQRLDEYGECLPSVLRSFAGVTEVWDNVEAGIEQMFVIQERPSGAGELELQLAVEGARVEAGDGGLELVTVAGDRFAYAELSVQDAEGRAVPASMRATEQGIVISIADSDAQYPLLVDPVSYNADWRVLGEQADDVYGNAVAGIGDVNADGYDDFMVGAPYYNDVGRVYAYYGRPGLPPTTPSWDKLGPANTSFGHAIANAGDVNADGYSDVVIGQPYAAGGGKVFVYYGGSGGLSTNEASPTILTSPLDPGLFGYSVAGVGDVNGDHKSDVLVGAPYGQTDAARLREGYAYLYLAGANGLNTSHSWSRHANVKASFFGLSVAGLGDINGDGLGDAIVGAPGYTDGGRVWVYVGHAGGTLGNVVWTDYGGTYAGFGTATAGAGDLNGDGYSDMLVGAPKTDDPDELNVGSVWAYYNTADGYGTSYSYELGSIENDMLGNSLAGAGDVNGDGYSDYVQGWVPDLVSGLTHPVKFGGPLDSDGVPVPAESTGIFRMPDYVAGAGDVNGDGLADVLLGTRTSDNSGMAEINFGQTLPPQPLDSDLAPAPLAAQYGTAVLLSDVSGDGWADLLVGAPSFDDAQQGAGKVYQYLSDGTKLGSASAWAPTGGQVNAQMGAALASGDFNGDGILDAAVAAPSFDAGETDEGRVTVYLGSSSGLSTTAWKTLEGNQIGATFGTALAAGDVNADGIADLIVGAPGFDGTKADEGRVFVFHGGSAGFGTNGNGVANRIVDGGKVGAAFFGKAVGVGDVTGDGRDDLVVGAPSYTGTVANEGCLFAYYAVAAGIPAAANWTKPGGISGTTFGGTLAVADFTGDGRADLVVGARTYSNGHTEEGRIFFYQSVNGALDTASWFRESDKANAHYGEVLTVGNVNNDTFADLGLGYPTYTNNSTKEGWIQYFLGSATPFVGASNGGTGTIGKPIGKSLALGDINGDGVSDFATGVKTSSNNGVRIGRHERGGINPRALKSGTSTVIPAGGKTAGNGFDVSVFARSPVGRTRVKLAVEVKLLGVPFDGSVVKTANWTDTGLTGVKLTYAVTGLTAAKAYHWRARVLYEPVYGIGPTHSPWYYGGNASNPLGVHLRTP